MLALVARIARPAHHREQREELPLIVAQRAQVDGLVVAQQAQLSGAVGTGARGEQRIVHDVDQIRPRRRVGGPHLLARRPEQAHAGGPRQQRPHQAHVGIEARPRLARYEITVRNGTHGSYGSTLRRMC